MFLAEFLSKCSGGLLRSILKSDNDLGFPTIQAPLRENFGKHTDATETWRDFRIMQNYAKCLLSNSENAASICVDLAEC